MSTLGRVDRVPNIGACRVITSQKIPICAYPWGNSEAKWVSLQNQVYYAINKTQFMDLHRGIVVLRKLSIALDLYEQVEEIYTAFYV